ncbi:MAG: CRISPR-associated protein Cas5 [Syntrophorhabdus sp. PtaU1.Bin050]|jgi:CRISPR-associated protein Cas5d|nr:MAG: CRISPR-associated protein Cas5 [Syntrophorhabdus sp. PtaU1.Bin050]
MDNIVEFQVHGKTALFTDPLTKIGGEKCSYHIPTYEALKGIVSSVYWKPTFIWIIDQVRIMNRIKTQTKGMKPIKYYGGGNDLSIYTYLTDVEYQVRAHFEWNFNRKDMEKDRNDMKHWIVAKRMIERGGRRDVFLGTRECQGYVEPCPFQDGKGFYDESDEITYSLMFHGFDYPDEFGKNELYARFWNPTMTNGVINFVRPEVCPVRRLVKAMKGQPPASSGLEDESLQTALAEEGLRQ